MADVVIPLDIGVTMPVGFFVALCWYLVLMIVALMINFYLAERNRAAPGAPRSGVSVVPGPSEEVLQGLEIGQDCEIFVDWPLRARPGWELAKLAGIWELASDGRPRYIVEPWAPGFRGRFVILEPDLIRPIGHSAAGKI